MYNMYLNTYDICFMYNTYVKTGAGLGQLIDLRVVVMYLGKYWKGPGNVGRNIVAVCVRCLGETWRSRTQQMIGPGL